MAPAKKAAPASRNYAWFWNHFLTFLNVLDTANTDVEDMAHAAACIAVLGGTMSAQILQEPQPISNWLRAFEPRALVWLYRQDVGLDVIEQLKDKADRDFFKEFVGFLRPYVDKHVRKEVRESKDQANAVEYPKWALDTARSSWKKSAAHLCKIAQQHRQANSGQDIRRFKELFDEYVDEFDEVKNFPPFVVANDYNVKENGEFKNYVSRYPGDPDPDNFPVGPESDSDETMESEGEEDPEAVEELERYEDSLAIEEPEGDDESVLVSDHEDEEAHEEDSPVARRLSRSTSSYSPPLFAPARGANWVMPPGREYPPFTDADIEMDDAEDRIAADTSGVDADDDGPDEPDLPTPRQLANGIDDLSLQEMGGPAAQYNIDASMDLDAPPRVQHEPNDALVEYQSAGEPIAQDQFCHVHRALPFECLICKGDFTLREAQPDSGLIAWTICGHAFHTRCLNNWVNEAAMDTSNQCPLCRRVLCVARERVHPGGLEEDTSSDDSSSIVFIGLDRPR
ncbi:hypothetical protein BU26DRAFT_510259 [Trematosphaeria pertusa]|uniref:RING-type domain-containing protein n=1 Tax=Trematosphaeria pertusa TaxID=390896 RepID=A0A6A6HYG2_9PLEO|nr:uncharacterized protein BU26DRAFT_510259 [Trematosphaeria pertusa]KAF2243056.1 hypothetical protein BU26DRAFT_510259 [Trematosphaeria pertusa]